MATTRTYNEWTIPANPERERFMCALDLEAERKGNVFTWGGHQYNYGLGPSESLAAASIVTANAMDISTRQADHSHRVCFGKAA